MSYERIDNKMKKKRRSLNGSFRSSPGNWISEINNNITDSRAYDIILESLEQSIRINGNDSSWFTIGDALRPRMNPTRIKSLISVVMSWALMIISRPDTTTRTNFQGNCGTFFCFTIQLKHVGAKMYLSIFIFQGQIF